MISAEELAARRAAYVPRPTEQLAGALEKYARLVGPAHEGAVSIPAAPDVAARVIGRASSWPRESSARVSGRASEWARTRRTSLA